jgi:hypothetical protein
MELSDNVLRPDVIKIDFGLRQGFVLSRIISPDQFFDVEGVDELVLAAVTGKLVSNL